MGNDSMTFQECDFNKKTGELRLKRHSAWDMIMSPFTYRDNVSKRTTLMKSIKMSKNLYLHFFSVVIDLILFKVADNKGT